MAIKPTPYKPVEHDGTDVRVGALRGAGVSSVDVRRLGRVVGGVVIVGLVVLGVVLFVAGTHKNAQITELKTRGVPVNMTVTGCTGLIGGSGSNPAGYSCHGTFSLGGHAHDDQIPGDVAYRPGERLAGISVADDPALFSTPSILRTQHNSAGVYVVPLVLTVFVALLVGGTFASAKRRRPSG